MNSKQEHLLTFYRALLERRERPNGNRNGQKGHLNDPNRLQVISGTWRVAKVQDMRRTVQIFVVQSLNGTTGSERVLEERVGK